MGRDTLNYFLGIDPGKTGAFAIINEDLTETKVWTADCPIAEIKTILLNYQPKFAVLELVRSMNTWKKSSIESLNRSAGQWQGIIGVLEIPYIECMPSKWQRATMGKTNHGDKKITLQWSRQMFPQVDLPYVKDADKADALCIALYASKYFKGEVK